MTVRSLPFALLLGAVACGTPDVRPPADAPDAGHGGGDAGAPDGGSTTQPAAPVDVATGESGPRHLAASATHLWWADDQGRLRRAPLGGGSAETVHTAPGGVVTGLALDDTQLFWAEMGEKYLLYRRPLAGPGAEAQTFAESGGLAEHLVVDGTRLYFAALQRIYARVKEGSPLADPYTVTDAKVDDLVQAGDDLYFSGQYTVKRSGKTSGSTATTVGTYPGLEAFLSVDETHVYAAVHAPQGSASQTKLVRLPRAGSNAAAESLASVAGRPTSSAVDAAHTYATAGRAVWRVAKAGGQPESLAENESGPNDLVVIPGGVCWTTTTSVRCWRE